MDQELDELYRAPFDEFVKRRDALAKDLRKEKRREEADAVKALKKPALPAWALNQLDRGDIDGLLAAGAALRQARGGDTLRDATREERDAVENLASRAEAVVRDAGLPLTGKTRSELRDTLHAAALDEDARELLAAGRLVEPRQAVGVFGGAAPAASPPRKPKPETKARKKPKPKPETKAKKKPDEAEAKRRREQEAAARAALRDAERAVKERERDVAAAQRDLDQARGELERARRRVT